MSTLAPEAAPALTQSDLVIHENRGLNPYIEDVAYGTPHAGSMACALASTSGSFAAMSPSSRAAATVG